MLKLIGELQLEDIPFLVWIVGGQGEEIEACYPEEATDRNLWKQATMSRLVASSEADPKANCIINDPDGDAISIGAKRRTRS